MGMIRISPETNQLIVKIHGDELLTENCPLWPIQGNVPFGILVGRVGLQKILEKIPGFDPSGIGSIRSEFANGYYITTVTMRTETWRELLATRITVPG